MLKYNGKDSKALTVLVGIATLAKDLGEPLGWDGEDDPALDECAHPSDQLMSLLMTFGCFEESAPSDPFDVQNVYGIFRTLPIRVGGNSGDTGGGELDWKEVSEMAGYEVMPEQTTVTKRQRRIFEFSDKDMLHAIRVNRPTYLMMTFAIILCLVSE